MAGPGCAPPPTAAAADPPSLEDLEGVARDRAIPVVRDGFVGIYRWHAKRELRQVPWVRAAVQGPEVVGVSMLDLLLPEVGYVYYIAVLASHRRRGVGARLLDDALQRFRAQPVEVVYAAVQDDNVASRRLFEGRGFRLVARKETGWKEGGLGAWGLRSRMMLVSGEELLGLRLRPPAASSGPPGSGPPGSTGPREPGSGRRGRREAGEVHEPDEQ